LELRGKLGVVQRKFHILEYSLNVIKVIIPMIGGWAGHAAPVGVIRNA
jgi:hypothetical protein